MESANAGHIPCVLLFWFFQCSYVFMVYLGSGVSTTNAITYRGPNDICPAVSSLS